MPSYWIETLGCPKNVVDSAKLSGHIEHGGFEPADRPEIADLIVVNTCAFIESARAESIEVVLELADARKLGAKVVVTGCMAERYREELEVALPEVDLVAGFGESPVPEMVPVELGLRRIPSTFDLLLLPRPASTAPWAYLKVAEGCDRRCGFCAIPTFRGDQRSRTPLDVLAEAGALASSGVQEVVLVAQDLVSYGRDRRRVGREDVNDLDAPSAQPILDLLAMLDGTVPWIRLLYLYPSGLTDGLIEAVLRTQVPYFDLSLQHVSRPLLRAMRRWGDAERFLARIERIRALDSFATFRSSFILGYPGETEEDQRHLVRFLEAAQLDWAGFFSFSAEEGTPALTMGDQVPGALALERLAECSEVQDAITSRRRDALVGQTRTVLVDSPGNARSVHEAPEIDGIIAVPTELRTGGFHEVVITGSLGTDLMAMPR
ncbi:MAG TPA: 30S ribosomal protein S12 methylthiotransferase RimO [Acidimicrobiales bacterium]|jgi:ribosomal protein S12 methylthiotransferase|nr:30S ribosomal protein S12 methylthiotransferase RimO [Acidimicrobiales bacterium]